MRILLLSLMLGMIPMLRSVEFYQAPPQSKSWKTPAWADTLQNPFAGDASAIKQGQKIYKQQCAVCHGNRGRGDGPAGIALNPRPADLTSETVQKQSDGALFWKITTGRGPMPAFKTILSEEDRWKVVAYLRTLRKNKK